MRIRSIKPDFWSDEKISALPSEAVLLAVGLQNYADDEGFFNANPKLVAAALFPLRNLSRSVPALLRELSKIGFVVVKKLPDGREIGHLALFLSMQVINKPVKSSLKALFNNETTDTDGKNTGGLREPSINTTGGIGGEGKGDGDGKGNGIQTGPTLVGLVGDIEPFLSKAETETTIAEIYDAYPRHEARAKAEKAILTALRSAGKQATRGRADELLAAVRAYAVAVRAWPEAQRYADGRDLVPLPASWFNGRRWEDDRSAWAAREEATKNGAGAGPAVFPEGPNRHTGGIPVGMPPAEKLSLGGAT